MLGILYHFATILQHTFSLLPYRRQHMERGKTNASI
nr:MAG TPA: hypothetical protein [Caudoviricetes sp.]